MDTRRAAWRGGRPRGRRRDGVRRSELVARIRSTQAEFEDLLAGPRPDEMTRPGVADDWSVKDMLAHIAWYEAEEAEFYGETNGAGSPLWKVPQDARNHVVVEEARAPARTGARGLSQRARAVPEGDRGAVRGRSCNAGPVPRHLGRVATVAEDRGALV